MKISVSILNAKDKKETIKILNKIKIIYIILTYQSRRFVIQDKI